MDTTLSRSFGVIKPPEFVVLPDAVSFNLVMVTCVDGPLRRHSEEWPDDTAVGDVREISVAEDEHGNLVRTVVASDRPGYQYSSPRLLRYRLSSPGAARFVPEAERL